MLNTKSFLSVDFGAGSLKLAEFEVNEAGVLGLKQYAVRPLGLEGSQDAKREAVVLKALQEILAERGIKGAPVNVCAPGFHVFSKFVKLPPVDPGKVTQIIQYEAQQNVPFPLSEVVWDYQILGTAAGGELEVLLVAVKSDIVEGLFKTVESAGLKLQLCDASPAALCNAFRYNYGELDDCSMLLDIGAKTSNLLFFEKGKVFARSINLGANAITTDFATEAKLKFDQAERIKIAEGFVSLGGAYEEPENPHQAAISKIARNFMTRLHIQVNQTLQFYRGQQGGSAPARVYLAGGASIMPYTAQFFAEKLNVPVEYFNPFRRIQIDPGINLEELSPVAHALGEVVGLGLRNLATCPIELNLMPASTLRWQSFNQKKPYFIATLASLVAMAFALGLFFDRLTRVKEERAAALAPTLSQMQSAEQRFKKAHGDLKRAQTQLDETTDWLAERHRWLQITRDLRASLLRTEDLMRRRLGTDTGLWIERLNMLTPSGDPAAPVLTPGSGNLAPSPGGFPGGMMGAEAELFARRYGIQKGAPMGEEALGGAPPPPPPALNPDGTPADPAAGGSNAISTNEVSTLQIIFRSVNIGSVASANSDIAFALENELRASPWLDPTNTALTGQITVEDPTFTFGCTLKLKHPLKL
jgi:type IV pilus assembly protein PilM